MSVIEPALLVYPCVPPPPPWPLTLSPPAHLTITLDGRSDVHKAKHLEVCTQNISGGSTKHRPCPLARLHRSIDQSASGRPKNHAPSDSHAPPSYMNEMRAVCKKENISPNVPRPFGSYEPWPGHGIETKADLSTCSTNAGSPGCAGTLSPGLEFVRIK